MVRSWPLSITVWALGVGVIGVYSAPAHAGGAAHTMAAAARTRNGNLRVGAFRRVMVNTFSGDSDQQVASRGAAHRQVPRLAGRAARPCGRAARRKFRAKSADRREIPRATRRWDRPCGATAARWRTP